MDKTKEMTVKSLGLTDDELELINKFSVREMKSEDVYAFSLTLCDNEIDRDGERFDNGSLTRLKDLFLGVTGIFDHVHSSKNQTAMRPPGFLRIKNLDVNTSQGKYQLNINTNSGLQGPRKT